MSRLTHALTLPLRLAPRAGPTTVLPRPCVSVGNLALGGRAKTPLTAALAEGLLQAGFRVAVLLRGYPRVSRRSAPRVLLRVSPEPACWRSSASLDGGPPALVSVLAPTAGDEAAWHAGSHDALVVAHPDRALAARAALAVDPHLDLFLLDDGFQGVVRADLHLLLVHPDDLSGRRALRERPSAQRRADRVLRLGVDLCRRGLPLRRLDSGALEEPEEALLQATAVGDPDSVAALAERQGVRLAGRLWLRDHHGPSSLRLRFARRPLLLTEKDAVGWAARSSVSGYVLGQSLDGVEPVLARVLDLLGGPR